MKKKLLLFVVLFTLVFIPRLKAACEVGYKVVYDANGGSGASDPMCVVDTLSEMRPKRSGYKFLGWAESPTATTPQYAPAEYIELDRDMTLYAVWVKGYKINYDAQGGKITSTTKTVYTGYVYGTLLTPTRKGYSFLGWYTQSTGGELITNTTTVTSKKTHTIYAHWKKIKYTINYELNNGINNEDNRTYYYITTGTFELKTPTKKGYRFLGWYTNSTYKTKVSYVYKGTAGNKTFYARWTPIKYSISFYGNGNTSGSTLKQTGLKYNKSYVLNKNGFKKTDYVFVNWNTKADGTGKTYDNEATIKNLAKAEGKVVKLYAQWKRKEYKIRYVLDGGVNPDNQYKTYTKASSITLKTPTKEGYKFLGWYTESDFINKVTGISKGTTGNKVFYARWKFNAYTVRYVLYGGENPSDAVTTYKYNEEHELPTPTRKGYQFLGWYTEDTYENRIESITPDMTGNLVLYSKWEKLSYTITYNLNGGTNPSNVQTTYSVTDEIILPIPSKGSDLFLGWYTESTFANEVTKINKGTIGNKVFYAQWVANETYTITYVLNGGTNPSGAPTSYNQSSEISLPTPTKTGYTFGGWYTESSFQNRVERIEKRSSGNKIFYAKWDIINYTITYALNGGTNQTGNVSSYNVASNTITLLTPTKSGYEFLGWYKESSFVNQITNIPTGSTGNITVYAKWQKLTSYSIGYYLNGGTNPSGVPISYTKVDTVELPTPTRKGYSFEGWYTDNTFGTKVTTIPEGSTGNKVFYARWTIINYTVTYNLNGGDNPTGAVTNYNVNTSVNLPAPIKRGYTFAGWYENSSFTGSSVSSISAGTTGNKTYYAKWNIVTYSITYNPNGASIPSGTPASYNVTTPKITLPTLTKAGYNFGGWYEYSDFSGSAVTTIPQGSTGNKTYYAKWTTVTYTITYNLNGGTNASGAPTSYAITTSTITLPTPTKKGYSFKGWFDNSGLTGTAITTIPVGSTGNKTFYAKWQIVNYTITYNLNGGTNGSGAVTSYNVNSSTITLPTPTKSGYVFGGWYTSSTFSGSAVTTIASGSTGNKTYYAKWDNVPTYTITYNTNGGTISGSKPTTYTELAAVTLPTNVTKTGYTFKGWFDNSGLTGTAITNIPVGSTGNKTYYAKWQAKSYSITYISEGSTYDTGTYTTGSTPTLITPSEPGRTFKGWYTNSSFSGSAVTTVPANSTGDLIYYAKWTYATYLITYNVNGGNLPSSATMGYKVIDTVTLPTPTKSGYGFDGWYTSSSFSGSPVTTIKAGTTGDKTYYAKWTAVSTYSITYKLNGGTNPSGAPTSYNNYQTVTLPIPTKSGYGFDGWYTSSTFSGSPVTEIPKGTTGNKTYYAKWGTPTTYTITYNLNGGTNPSGAPNNYTNYDTVTLPTPTRSGYTFIGWYDNASFTGSTYKTIEKGTTGNKTFYAKWQENLTERTYSQYTFYTSTYDTTLSSLDDVRNTVYNVFNKGLTEFTATCDNNAYDSINDCFSDFLEITQNQDTMKAISDYVSPYNSFNSFRATRTISGSTGTVKMYITYNYSSTDKTAIDNKLDNIIMNNNIGTLTTSNKIKTFHNYLITHVTYDDAAAASGDTTLYANSFSAYGALINGSSVCQGYADAMAIFLDRYKIPNLRVSSDTHTWNLVYVSGAWKNLDATWDDMDDSANTIRYDYYLITTPTMQSLDPTNSHRFIISDYLEANS